MAIQNQGFRKDLNLEETTNETVAINNLAGSGMAGDLRIIQNNLRNISILFCKDGIMFIETIELETPLILVCNAVK